jgi:hypothetical protein
VKDDVDHVVLARSMSMPSFRACASSPRKRIASGEKPAGRPRPTSLIDEHEHVVPALERRLVMAVRGTPSLRGVTTSFGANSPRFSASSRAPARASVAP